MNFLKNFFDDESKIIGLCGFEMMKPKYSQNPIENDFFFNPFKGERLFTPNYETNFINNALLL